MTAKRIPERRKPSFNMLSKVSRVGEGVLEKETMEDVQRTYDRWAKHEDASEPNPVDR